MIDYDRVARNAKAGYTPEMKAVLAARRLAGIRQSAQRGMEMAPRGHVDPKNLPEARWAETWTE